MTRVVSTAGVRLASAVATGALWACTGASGPSPGSSQTTSGQGSGGSGSGASVAGSPSGGSGTLGAAGATAGFSTSGVSGGTAGSGSAGVSGGAGSTASGAADVDAAALDVATSIPDAFAVSDVFTDVNDGPMGEAFDTTAGVLNVDYAGYLSKHDVTFSAPNANPLYGLTVGNGRMGAMVWSQNGLTMQVSGVDTSEQTAFGSGLVNLSTMPAMDSGYTRFQQVLSLYDGTLTTTYDSNRRVTIMGSPNSEVMGIHVEDSRAGVSSISFDVGLWDVSKLGNSGDTPNIGTWQTVATYADATGAGISRGQADPNNFGYTLAATVEGASFTTQTVGSNNVRLTIAPAPSYTIWLSSATRLNAPNHDSVTRAKSLLSGARTTGYGAILPMYTTFWHDFWSKSFVQYSNASGDADYLESFYYLSTYATASGGYGNYPFQFINGVYRATQDSTKWSNGYWYWNQRDVYNSFLASNHPDVMSGFNGLYSRNFDVLKASTMARFNFAGIRVPETMGWDGNSRGETSYTTNIYSTGTEAAENMYLQYAFTGDAAYLSGTAYPFMREVANFYVSKLSKNAAGMYYMASSNAHETYWNVQNAITDLAAVRSLFPIAIRTSKALGLDAAASVTWQDVLDHLVAYPTSGADYAATDTPNPPSHNGENVACELIWPYGVTGIGAPDYARALSTWRDRPNPYGNVWANDAIQAARLGLGDAAYAGMKTMLGKYQNYPNGFTNNTNGVFEYWGVNLSAMNESLLQSYDDKVRVFPALPTDATFAARFTLAGKGGFLVSSEMESGEIKYIGIKSQLGNPVTVVNPWGVQALQVKRQQDGAVVAASSSPELTFATTAGAVYVVERVAKPLSRYVYARLTGTPNRGVKHLSNPPCTLGM